MTTLRVWAPRARNVQVAFGDERRPMEPDMSGWWRLDAPDAGHGEDYAFVLDGGDPLPDPRGTWQPHGVHGPSRLYDHARFDWHDTTWRGAPLKGSVLYELHVATFTPEGTFDAAIDRLDHLVDLGVDTVELLPVASFDGPHGWGYDGVALYAVHEPYGGPDGLKRFVDACHRRGLAVVLDVVYNHLGPSGNYLAAFGPYFTETHSTPWGQAVNLDAPGSDEVRAWILDNARTWLHDFHIDGLRLDAVHALVDTRATHLLEELATAVDSLGAHLRKPLFLVAESDLNDPRLIRPREAGGYGLTAQWDDDVHHALHATLTGETQGYYVDFGPLAVLAEALTTAFVHAGTYSTFRRRTHGRPVDPTATPAHRFVTYLQNHDQIGNRAQGDRISSLLSPGLVKVGAALLFTAPFTPMLFMGEEWGASTPWQFFTSFHDPALAEAVRTGRREEFASHGWEPGQVPDPQDPATVERSRLDWMEREKEPHADLLDWHRKLIALRRERLELTDPQLDHVSCRYDERARWFVLRRGSLATVCNLGPGRQTIPVDGLPNSVLLASTPGFVYRAGEVELDGESVAVLALA